MRKSKEEAEKTRRRIVTSAAAEFRERGIVATGLNDLMQAAGLTHGGFYRHFDSKEQLVAEATDEALAALIKRMKDAAGRGRTKSRSHEGLAAAVGEYLSLQHRDDPRDGCPLAAMGSELARAGAKTRETATAGFQKLVEILASEFQGIKPDRAKKRALVAAATLVGALTISRIVTDPILSKAILREAVDSITSDWRHYEFDDSSSASLGLAGTASQAVNGRGVERLVSEQGGELYQFGVIAESAPKRRG